MNKITKSQKPISKITLINHDTKIKIKTHNSIIEQKAAYCSKLSHKHKHKQKSILHT